MPFFRGKLDLASCSILGNGCNREGIEASTIEGLVGMLSDKASLSLAHAASDLLLNFPAKSSSAGKIFVCNPLKVSSSDAQNSKSEGCDNTIRILCLILLAQAATTMEAEDPQQPSTVALWPLARASATLCISFTSSNFVISARISPLPGRGCLFSGIVEGSFMYFSEKTGCITLD